MATVLNRLQLTSTTLLAGLLLSLASCAGQQASRNSVSETPSSPAASSPTSTPPVTRQPLAASPSAAAEANTVPVTLYKADSQCENFVPEQIRVPADRPIEAAVGEAIAAQSSADFDLSGYRVSRDNNGVTTVDFRLAPDSPRKIVSLSTCEQFALFGSIRETLTRNSQWQVKSVRFTERGKEIVL